MDVYANILYLRVVVGMVSHVNLASGLYGTFSGPVECLHTVPEVLEIRLEKIDPIAILERLPVTGNDPGERKVFQLLQGLYPLREIGISHIGKRSVNEIPGDKYALTRQVNNTGRFSVPVAWYTPSAISVNRNAGRSYSGFGDRGLSWRAGPDAHPKAEIVRIKIRIRQFRLSISPPQVGLRVAG